MLDMMLCGTFIFNSFDVIYSPNLIQIICTFAWIKVASTVKTCKVKLKERVEWVRNEKI